jgi:AcrR family transcriptional regulator
VATERARATPEDDELAALVDAAFRVLAGHDATALSVASVLAEARLGTRAFYRHFRSKDELLVTMFRWDAEYVVAQLTRAVGRADSHLAALEVWVEQSLALVFDPRKALRVRILMSAEVSRARGYSVERARVTSQLQAVLGTILAAGQADGTFPSTEPHQDARALNAIIQDLLEQRSRGLPTLGHREARAHTLRFAHRALGVPPVEPAAR